MHEQRLIYRIIPAIVSLAIFMEAVDTTVINTAIPVMAHSLRVPPIDLKIALISYLLSLAIFIPVSGWMADRFGARRIFILALSIFTASSFACGWVHQLGQLVVARAIQGLGGAMSMPVGRLIIVRLVKRSEFMVTMNRVILPALIGPALGPLVGGFMVEYFSWPWIFWINVPFGLLTIILAWRFLHNIPQQPTHKLDILGFILFGLGLAGLTFGLSMLSENVLPIPMILCGMAISFCLLVVYWRRARRQDFPLINFSLFNLRTLRIAVWGNFTARLGFAGMPFLLPLLLQIALGYSALQAGLLVALSAIGAMTVKTFSQHVVKYFGFRRLLINNTLMIAFCLILFSLVQLHTVWWLIALLCLTIGFFSSMQYSAMNPLAYAEVKQEHTASATSMMTAVQQLSNSFGVALSALFLRIFGNFHAHVLTPAVFHATFITLSIITVVASTIFMFLKPEDGQNLYLKER